MPKLHYWLPKWAPMAGVVLFGLVLLKKGVRPGLIQHELEHYNQQKIDGFLRYYWRYVFFPSWRVKYEAAAYAIQVRMGEETPEWCAKTLSGPLYLWPCSYQTALDAIKAQV